jgi:hypothetical protein
MSVESNQLLESSIDRWLFFLVNPLPGVLILLRLRLIVFAYGREIFQYSNLERSGVLVLTCIPVYAALQILAKG